MRIPELSSFCLIGALLCGFVLGEPTKPVLNPIPPQGSWKERAEWVSQILGHPNVLANTSYQRSLVETLARESRQATWEARSESETYEHYYDNLLRAVQQVASNGYLPAWKTLVETNYNDDSDFAKWLSRQTQAQRTLLDLADNKAQPPLMRGRVLFVLAQSCGEPAGSGNIDRIRERLRDGLTAKDEALVLSSIRGLGVCGTAEDIPHLRRISETTDNRWLANFARQSAIKIEAGR